MLTQKNKGLIVMFFFLQVFFAYGLEEGGMGSLSGKIYISRPSVVYIFLVDEENSKIPLSGELLKIIPSQKDVDAGFVSFMFSNLEEGIYGIRCFQDLNNNKKLDKGMFGPCEPWGFSWNVQPPPKYPNFKKYCHLVNDDIQNIKIYLSE